VNSKKPIIGVLGLGSIGLRHANNFIHLGCDVFGYDPDPERQKMFSSCGGRVVAERDNLFADSEAIVIASPNAFHLDDLREAIKCNRNVFIEKPLAHTDLGVEENLAEAEKRKLIVFVGFNLRFHPVVQAARELLAQKGLGKLLWARFIFSDYLPSWRPLQDYKKGYTSDPETGGVLFDSIHEIDLAQYLLGPGRAIAAALKNTGFLGIASEDCVDLVLCHDNGVQSNIHLDYVTRPRKRLTEIAGSEGYMSLDFDRRKLLVEGHSGQVIKELEFEGSYDDDYIEEARSFLSYVSGGGRPNNDGREGLAVLRIVLQARRLGASGVAI
jgi:predicted dehydrogenase